VRQSPAERIRRHPVAAMLALAGVLAGLGSTAGLAAASSQGHPALRPGNAAAISVPDGRAAAPPDADRSVTAPLPVRLIIPAIGVRTRLIKLGRTAAGALQVPATTSVAGWYTGSPRPGEIGAAVIAGHVDSYRGPGVFFRLRQLTAGDLILVRRANGSLVAFRVVQARVVRKATFPTQAVYGAAPAAELRLITCGGTFDYATRSYLANLIVTAVEVRWQHKAAPSARREPASRLASIAS
jgi:sortase (surface protein transpeptidase)